MKQRGLHTSSSSTALSTPSPRKSMRRSNASSASLSSPASYGVLNGGGVGSPDMRNGGIRDNSQLDFSTCPVEHGSGTASRRTVDRRSAQFQAEIDQLRRAHDDQNREISQLKLKIDAEKQKSREAQRDKNQAAKTARETLEKERQHLTEIATRRAASEKETEMRGHYESLIKKKDAELRQQIKFREEEVKAARAELIRERDDQVQFVREDAERRIMARCQEEASSEKSKLLAEMWSLRENKVKMEEVLESLKTADHEKSQLIKKMKLDHADEKSELLRRSKQEGQKDAQRVRLAERIVQQKDSELARQTYTSTQLEADKERLQDAVSRYQQGDSLSKRSVSSLSHGAAAAIEDDSALSLSLTPSRPQRSVESSPKVSRSSMSPSVRRNAAFEDRLSAMKAENAMLKQQLEKAKASVSDSTAAEEKVKKLRVRNNELTTLARQLQSKVKTSQTEISALKAVKEGSSSEIKHHSQQYQRQRAKDQAEHRQHLIVKDQEIAKLKDKLDSLLHNTPSKQSGKQALSPSSDLDAETKSKIVHLTRSNLALEKRLDVFFKESGSSGQMVKLQQHVTDLESKLAALRHQNEEAESQLERLPLMELEVESVKTRSQSLVQCIEELENEKRHQSELRACEQSAVQDLKSELQSMSTKLEEYDQLCADNNQLQDELSGARQEADRTAVECTALKGQVTSLQQLLQQQDQSGGLGDEEFTKLRSELAATKMEISSLKSQAAANKPSTAVQVESSTGIDMSSSFDARSTSGNSMLSPSKEPAELMAKIVSLQEECAEKELQCMALMEQVDKLKLVVSHFQSKLDQAEELSNPPSPVVQHKQLNSKPTGAAATKATKSQHQRPGSGSLHDTLVSGGLQRDQQGRSHGLHAHVDQSPGPSAYASEDNTSREFTLEEELQEAEPVSTATASDVAMQEDSEASEASDSDDGSDDHRRSPITSDNDSDKSAYDSDGSSDSGDSDASDASDAGDKDGDNISLSQVFAAGGATHTDDDDSADSSDDEGFVREFGDVVRGLSSTPSQKSKQDSADSEGNRDSGRVHPRSVKGSEEEENADVSSIDSVHSAGAVDDQGHGNTDAIVRNEASHAAAAAAAVLQTPQITIHTEDVDKLADNSSADFGPDDADDAAVDARDRPVSASVEGHTGSDFKEREKDEYGNESDASDGDSAEDDETSLDDDDDESGRSSENVSVVDSSGSGSSVSDSGSDYEEDDEQEELQQLSLSAHRTSAQQVLEELSLVTDSTAEPAGKPLSTSQPSNQRVEAWAEQGQAAPAPATATEQTGTGQADEDSSVPLTVVIAKYDYDSHEYSPNNPDEELSFSKGDYIYVRGDVDEDGFYHGELLDGSRGLVPSNFVELVITEDAPAGDGEADDGETMTISRDDDSNDDDDDNDCSDDEDDKEDTSDIDYNIQAPTRLTVQRQMAEDSCVVIQWTPPAAMALNSPEHSATAAVTGYHVLVDGHIYETTRANQTTSTIQGLCLDEEQYSISVRTVTAHGVSPDPATLLTAGKRNASLCPVDNVQFHNNFNGDISVTWTLPADHVSQHDGWHQVSVNGRSVTSTLPVTCSQALLPDDVFESITAGPQSNTYSVKVSTFSTSLQEQVYSAQVLLNADNLQLVQPPVTEEQAHHPSTSVASDNTAPHQAAAAAAPSSSDAAGPATTTAVRRASVLSADGSTFNVSDIENMDELLSETSPTSSISSHPNQGEKNTKSITATGLKSKLQSSTVILDPMLQENEDHSTRGANAAHNDHDDFSSSPAESLSGGDWLSGPCLYTAIYDYDPSLHSPNPDTSEELGFKEGDLLMVLRSVDSCGFLYGERLGKRGLIPSNMVEKVECDNEETKQHLLTVVNQYQSQQQSQQQQDNEPASDTSNKKKARRRSNSSDDGTDEHHDTQNQQHLQQHLQPHHHVQSREVTSAFSHSRSLTPIVELETRTPTPSSLDAQGVLSMPAGLITPPTTAARTAAAAAPSAATHRLTTPTATAAAGVATSAWGDGKTHMPQPVATVTEVNPESTERECEWQFARALYAYDPQTLSPNPDAETELTFSAGDILRTFGDIDADGFYQAELNGQTGLVPSNFVELLPNDIIVEGDDGMLYVRNEGMTAERAIDVGFEQESAHEEIPATQKAQQKQQKQQQQQHRKGKAVKGKEELVAGAEATSGTADDSKKKKKGIYGRSRNFVKKKILKK